MPNKVVALGEEGIKLDIVIFCCIILTSLGKMLSGGYKFRFYDARLQRALKGN